jgi:hypothetical protein
MDLVRSVQGHDSKGKKKKEKAENLTRARGVVIKIKEKRRTVQPTQPNKPAGITRRGTVTPRDILDCEKRDKTSLQAKPYLSGQRAERARYGLVVTVSRMVTNERGEHNEGCDDYVHEDGGCGRVGSFE